MAKRRVGALPKGSSAVIDACVLFESFPRAVILYLVYVGYLLPSVSRMIMDEFVRSLSEVRPDRPHPKMTKDEAEYLARHIVGKFKLVPTVFCEEDLKAMEKLKSKFKSGRAGNDAHVLWLAIITEGCFYIITDNVKDFPRHKGIAAVSPDDMLTSMLGSSDDLSELAREALAYGALRTRAETFNGQIHYMEAHRQFPLLREKLAANPEIQEAIQEQLDLWKSNGAEWISEIG